VEDRRVEIRVVPNVSRQKQVGPFDGHEAVRFGSPAVRVKNPHELASKLGHAAPTERHQPVQRRIARGLNDRARQRLEQAELARAAQIEDLIADSDTDPWWIVAPLPPEHTERQILNRKIRARRIGSFNPAP
jgi:hypothetical protein